MSRLRGDPSRTALDARVLDWMREPWAGDEARFDALARELFAFQLAHCEPYARFCRGRGIAPGDLASWEAIPPVPAGAFKEVALRSFPAGRAAHVFRTSGTSTERRGELWLDTLELYEASLLASFGHFMLPDLATGERARILVLTPSPDEVPDSSLSHMFGAVLEHRGDAQSGFFVRGGELDAAALESALELAAAAETPVVLAGTAFGFVHLLDSLAAADRRHRLPAGSRAMETGGFKGRVGERSRDALYAEIEARLGIPAARIANQYGMTELGSQFHDAVLAQPGAARRKLGPPWARVRIVHPETGATCDEGEAGIVVIYDLANTGSVLAIQTADLGRRIADGFEVLGRAPGAEARGCSIAADEMLGAEAR